MKYRVYNESNYSTIARQYFPTYFKTKKSAMEYASTISNAIVERKICSEWVLEKKF